MITALLMPLEPYLPRLPRHLARAHGEADQRRITQLKLRDQLVQVSAKVS